jgi:hypothetical protein
MPCASTSHSKSLLPQIGIPDPGTYITNLLGEGPLLLEV